MKLAFKILTGLAAAFFGIASFSLVSLIFGWFETGEREIHRVHDLGWGALGFVLLTLGFLVQFKNPESKVSPLQQSLAVVIAFLGAMALSAEFSPAGLIFLAVTLLIMWLHPARDALTRLSIGQSRVLLGMTVLAALPLIKYAFDQAELERSCVAADAHCDESHYLIMAALSFGWILAGLIASAKNAGWTITAWCVAGAAVVWGLGSVIYPDLEGSLGTMWGALAIAWGVAFALVARAEAAKTSELAPA